MVDRAVEESSSSKYVYLPLDEEAGDIRLVTLLPGRVSSPVKISLVTTQLAPNSVPEFEALSYAWGSTVQKVDLGIVQDGVPLKHISITENLSQALPYLRHGTRPRILWIDAICVNQEDTVERSSQVGRMADIFKGAQRVVAWLGPNDRDSVTAMAILNDVAHQVVPNWDLYTIKPSARYGIDQRWGDPKYSLKSLCTPSEIDSINRLLGRTWFRRLWIWQEITLANSKAILCCGRDSILWSDFRSSLLCFFTKELPRDDSVQNDLSYLIGLCDYRPGDGFPASFENSHRAEYSDPRDRIYALLSLLQHKDSDLVRIKPDYSKPVAEVYKEFAITNYEHYGSLDIMKYSGFCTSHSSMPTWVPNWSTKLLYTRLNGSRIAAGRSKAIAIHSGPLLTVTGVLCTVVQDAKSFYNPIGDWVRSIAPTKVLTEGYLGQETMIEAFGRTLCNNVFADSFLPHLDTEAGFLYLASFVDYLKQLLPITTGAREMEITPSQSSDKHMSVTIDQVRSEIQEAASNRSFLTTSEGHIGIGPEETRPGDIVCVLLGLETPIILRPTSDGQFHIVGVCYMHGLMAAESLLGPLGKWRLVSRSSNGWSPLVLLHTETGEVKTGDPRLGPLPHGWRLAPMDQDTYGLDDQIFIETSTGYETVHDPRLTPEALRMKGVKLRDFILQ